MKRTKKILVITLVVILIILSLVAAGLFLFNKKQDDIAREKEEAIINAEENFKKLFENLEYSENKNEAVTLSYKMEKIEEGRYDVKAHVPLLNIETDTANAVNDEITNIFGKKLLEVVKENTAYSKYHVDYITYTNNNIISLIIKATLKEGSEPQRIIVKTYNYDLVENKLLSLKEYMELNSIDKNAVQAQIINYIRGKSENTDTALAQEYNLYIRDVRSDEYLIENIENYYIGQDGKIYIIFAYGNNNATETVDVVIVQK